MTTRPVRPARSTSPPASPIRCSSPSGPRLSITRRSNHETPSSRSSPTGSTSGHRPRTPSPSAPWWRSCWSATRKPWSSRRWRPAARSAARSRRWLSPKRRASPKPSTDRSRCSGAVMRRLATVSTVLPRWSISSPVSMRRAPSPAGSTTSTARPISRKAAPAKKTRMAPLRTGAPTSGRSTTCPPPAVCGTRARLRSRRSSRPCLRTARRSIPGHARSRSTSWRSRPARIRSRSGAACWTTIRAWRP